MNFAWNINFYCKSPVILGFCPSWSFIILFNLMSSCSISDSSLTESFSGDRFWNEESFNSSSDSAFRNWTSQLILKFFSMSTWFILKSDSRSIFDNQRNKFNTEFSTRVSHDFHSSSTQCRWQFGDFLKIKINKGVWRWEF